MGFEYGAEGKERWGKKENRKRGAILKMFTLRLAHWSASDATESAEYEETTMEGKRRIKEGEKEGYRKPHLHTVRMTPF